MKKFVLFTVSLLFCLPAGFTQGTWLNPLPQGNWLRDVAVVDSLNGYCAGSYGTVMKTSDGGATWAVLATGTTERFNTLDFCNASVGWTGSDSGRIYRTGNGGATWDLQYEDPVNDGVTDLCFTGPLHGCAVVNHSGAGHAELLVTFDGGLTWSAHIVGNNSYVTAISFPDSLHGWAVTHDGKIIFTTDGGMNWDQQEDFGSLTWFNSVFFADSLHGWACEDYSGKLYRTTDGGQNWTSKTLDKAAAKLFFTDNSTGYIGGIDWVNNQNKVWIQKTTNGGTTFGTRQYLAMNYLGSFEFSSPATGWLTGTSGAIFKTTNGNASWTRQTFEFFHANVTGAYWLLNGELGWATGGPGQVFHTADAGNSWNTQQTGVTSYLTAIQFTGPLHGWACGYDGAVIRTTDGGLTWQSVPVPTTQPFRSLAFTSPSTGVVVGDSGVVLRTADAGLTWEKTVPFPYTDLYSVFFTDSLHGWIAGLNHFPGWYAAFLKTNDGGLHWDTSHVDRAFFPYAMHFSDPKHGWVVGSDSTTLHTTDGGITWEFRQFPGASYVWSVFFMDSLSGVAGGESGSLFRSYNGGGKWDKVETGHDLPIQSLYVNNSGTCRSAGGDGSVMKFPGLLTGMPSTPKTTFDGGITAFPNPFTTSTIISYSLPAAQQAEVSIFTLTGEMVLTLANGKQATGKHQIAFRNDLLVPGIYLCRLKTPGGSSTCKLVVVR